MAQFSKEYLIEILNRYNAVENVEDDWEFLRQALVEEQAKLIEQMLLRTLDSQVAISRIEGIKWIISFIEKTLKQGAMAKEELKGTV